MCYKLQPCVLQAATVCATGCNHVCYKLQPYVLQAATVCATCCNRICYTLQPYVPPGVSRTSNYSRRCVVRRIETRSIRCALHSTLAPACPCLLMLDAESSLTHSYLCVTHSYLCVRSKLTQGARRPSSRLQPYVPEAATLRVTCTGGCGPMVLPAAALCIAGAPRRDSFGSRPREVAQDMRDGAQAHRIYTCAYMYIYLPTACPPPTGLRLACAPQPRLHSHAETSLTQAATLCTSPAPRPACIAAAPLPT